jgi:hypothetical protein
LSAANRRQRRSGAAKKVTCFRIVSLLMSMIVLNKIMQPKRARKTFFTESRLAQKP